MNKLAAILALCAACVFTASAAVQSPSQAQVPPQTQTPPPAPPQGQAPAVFRGGTDIITLDISVLDRDRKPVRGLKAADFTVFEDGKPQSVVAFDAVDLPDVVTPSAAWMTKVTPDVTTNTLQESRLFVMVMDDATLQNDPAAFATVKKAAHSVVEKLGPTDFMAVVFPRDNRNTQDFTNDHAKLTAAVDRYSASFAGMGRPSGLNVGSSGGGGSRSFAPATDTEAYYKQSSIDAVASAAEFLATVSDRRKAIIYVSVGVAVGFSSEPTQITLETGVADMALQGDLGWRTEELIRHAREGNVSVYTIDPCGLRVPGNVCGGDVGFLQVVANATGGHPVINTNDVEPGVAQIFRENNSFYLLGYRVTGGKQDGGLRRLQVKVDRPGVEVRYRSGYRAEDAAKAARDAAKNGPPSPLAKALSGIVPSPDMPLQVSLAPYAMPGKALPRVAIVLGLRQPAPAAAAESKVTETIELQTRAFTPEGSAQGSSRQTAKVVLREGATGDFRFEVLSLIDLKPGRYQLRLAAYSPSLGKNGSVYADVEVPDFAALPVSLSGVVLNLTPGAVAGGTAELKPLLPIVPTSERTFLRGATVSGFCRLYQGGNKKLVPVTVGLKIRDDRDRVVVDQNEVFPVARFVSATRAADMRFEVPIGRLGPGKYVLSIDATVGKDVAHRDVRFVVQ